MERQKNGFGIAAKSLTEAMKLKEILAKKGIAASLVRTPNSGKGCGYSLYIREKDAQKAKAVLRIIGRDTGGEI